MKPFLAVLLITSITALCRGEESLSSPPRCEVVPLPHSQVSFRIDGIEKLQWNFGDDEPVPYFYPLLGPEGASLTRMGHPGAPNHDHHRSVWFGHQDVAGGNFWDMAAKGTIRQNRWLVYADGQDEGVMAVELSWHDEEGAELLQQQVVAAVLPLADGEYALEIQSTFLPGRGRGETALGKTNFGLFAVRVAKGISAHFGGGELRNSEGAVGEAAIFGQRARWVDYSGPVAAGTGEERKSVVQGVTYFDHPENPRHPSRWHVRADGWMTASICFDDEWVVRRDQPLTLRYLLHAHNGGCDSTRSDTLQQEFAGRGLFIVERSTEPHQQFKVSRRSSEQDRRPRR